MAYCVTKTWTIIIKNVYNITTIAAYIHNLGIGARLDLIYLFIQLGRPRRLFYDFPLRHTYTMYILVPVHTYLEKYSYFCDLITRPIVWNKTSDK